MGNNIGAAGARELLKTLAHLTNLAHLHVGLNHNQVGAAGARELLKPLSHLTSITHIHVNL